MAIRTAKNLLLTGQPGCGKTTVVEHVIERLSGLRLAGFYTQEIRRQGQRLGFEAIGLGGGRAVLAHVTVRTGLRVSRYGIDVAALDRLVQSELGQAQRDADVYVIDEIGKMECLSPRFVELARRALDSPVPVLATIAAKGGGFPSEVKTRRDIQVVTVVAGNRDEIPTQLAAELRHLASFR